MVEEKDENKTPSVYASTKLSGNLCQKANFEDTNTNLIISRFYSMGPWKARYVDFKIYSLDNK